MQMKQESQQVEQARQIWLGDNAHGAACLRVENGRHTNWRLTVLACAVGAALGAALPSAAVAADDAQVRALQKRVDRLVDVYEKRIRALEERLQQAEAGALTAAPATAVTATQQGAAPRAGAAAQTASAFNPEVSLIVQGQVKQMKNAPGRTLAGFWPTDGAHSHGDEGVAGVDKRGFSVEHSELVLAANIDPYWRGQLILAAIDDTVEVEDAWVQTLALGHGLTLKGGRFRSGLGYLNEHHAHAWDFTDAPLMYQAMFGSHGAYLQDGVQLKWLLPTELMVEVGAEVARGHTFPGSDRNKNGAGSAVFFAHVGGDVGSSHSWRAGLSYLHTRTNHRAAEIHDANDVHGEADLSAKSQTWLADVVWKWAPDGNPKYRNFKVQAEYFSRLEDGQLSCTPEAGSVGGACSGAEDGYRRRQSGWYAQAVYQFTPNWRVGLRHERLLSGTAHLGRQIAAEVGTENSLLTNHRPQKTSVMADYSWSEYSRLRLQYAHDRSSPGLRDRQWTLQYVMSLGSHGAHRF